MIIRGGGKNIQPRVAVYKKMFRNDLKSKFNLTASHIRHRLTGDVHAPFLEDVESHSGTCRKQPDVEADEAG